jgi:hypothetical protein
MRMMADLPIIFISFGEPNAEENFNHLVLSALKVGLPHVSWVKDVKGFDAAHKAACARALSFDPHATEFVTVDADNRTFDSFWEIDLDRRPVVLKDKTLSWNALNTVNGLVYGNGGLKLWQVRHVQEMRTHEASINIPEIDFCWDNRYVQMHGCYSHTIINASADQAWRAGFREGVKLPMVNGKTPSKDKMREMVKSNWTNMRRFLQWSTVGADVSNGEAAILGSLEGFYYAHVVQGNPLILLNHEELGRLREDDQGPDASHFTLREKIFDYCGLFVPFFGIRQSKAIRTFLEWPLPNTEDPFERETWKRLTLPSSTLWSEPQ